MNNNEKTHRSGADESFDPEKTVEPKRFYKPVEPKPGDTLLGHYTILEKLGAGTMGVVYKCRDTVSGVDFAVKLVSPRLAANSDAMAAVRENFQLVQKLNHPGIANVKFLERDATRGDYYLVMEFVPGKSLQDWICERWNGDGIEVADALPILRQLAAALDYAHNCGRRGVIHRDVKPGNVMIDADGNVKLLDFGLAARVRSTMSMQNSNDDSEDAKNSTGTPAYMSPEQWEGLYPEKASDQYSLGVIAYEMLAGHLPYESGNALTLERAVLRNEPPPIDTLTEGQWAALRRAMNRTPKERFPNCGDFVNALAGAAPDVPQPAKEEPVAPEATVEPPPAVKTTTGKRGLWIVLALLVICGIGYGVHQHNESLKREAEIRRVAEENAKVDTNAERRELTLPGNVQLEMVKIKAGTFMMGSQESELGNWDREKQHRVTLTQDYWLGKYEVTQAQYEAVMGYNPSNFKGDNLPVESVSWDDAVEFCKKLNECFRDKLPPDYEFGLPTEAQWEYACRAGTTTALNNGKNLTDENYNCENLNEVGWYCYKNAENTTHPVGQKKPNAWGLYDMHGNVYEWCNDWYGKYGGDATDPVGTATGSSRVFRGGSWYYFARYCRSTFRFYGSPDNRYCGLGFRVALRPVQ